MSEGLHDPDLPPGAVVEVEVDKQTGEGIRNDGKRLRPAERNPWYVLATIAGVQQGTFSWFEIDADLAAKNRRYWNGWACAAMPEEKRAALAEKMELPAEDLAPLTEAERRKVEEEFGRRLGPEVQIPRPSETIDFRETHFLQTQVWGKCVFPSDALFHFSSFTGDAYFGSAIFSETASFGSTKFSGDASFGSATFSGRTGFGSTHFLGSASFRSATFSAEAYFASVSFSETASFRATKFGGAAYFGAATFSGPASFENATFSEEVVFGSSNFGGTADFDCATFKGEAIFASATFTGYADFESATFTGCADFGSATFTGYPKFIATWYKGAARFRDASFERPTSFRGAAFETVFPDLVGTVLHEDTDFSAADWTDVRDEERENIRVRAWADTPEDPEAAKASAAKIRHVLAQQGRPEDAHFFFRREMGFNRRIGGWWRRLPYRLFHWVSDYGHSIERPASGLALTILVPWMLVPWLCLLPEACAGQGPLGFWRELGLSLANTFSFFGFQRLYFDVEILQARDGWMQVMGGAQTVLGFALLFFLGLGLRNRFRLK